MFKYWTGSHTKHRLMYHLVWIPKYRKRVLKGKIKKRLLNIWYEGSKMNGWWIEEVNIMEDHVHMMIQIKPSDRVSEVVQRLKGASSKIIRKEYPELEEFLWGKSLWADGYFAETVGRGTYEEIKKYIKDQADIIPQEV
jgi:putative transposase